MRSVSTLVSLGQFAFIVRCKQDEEDRRWSHCMSVLFASMLDLISARFLVTFSFFVMDLFHMDEAGPSDFFFTTGVKKLISKCYFIYREYLHCIFNKCFFISAQLLSVLYLSCEVRYVLLNNSNDYMIIHNRICCVKYLNYSTKLSGVSMKKIKLIQNKDFFLVICLS